MRGSHGDCRGHGWGRRGLLGGARGRTDRAPTSPESQSQMLSTCRGCWGGVLRCCRGATSWLCRCRAPTVFSAMASCCCSACRAQAVGAQARLHQWPASYLPHRKARGLVFTKTGSLSQQSKRGSPGRPRMLGSAGWRGVGSAQHHPGPQSWRGLRGRTAPITPYVRRPRSRAETGLW